MRSQVHNAGSIALRALFAFLLASLALQAPSAAQTEAQFAIKPVVEKKIARLPEGALYWRVETFPTIAQAQAAEGPASLAAEIAGKAWLFSLGRQGGSTLGGTRVAEIGPVAPPAGAPEYLLRLNNASGPAGVKTPVHMHPGSETFYVLSGALTQRTPLGVMRISAGESMAGHAPGMAMEVSSSGSVDLNAIVLFVVDATKPFSEPAKF